MSNAESQRIDSSTGLNSLPLEIQLQIPTFLESEKDISKLTRVNRHFHELLTPYLYRRNVEHGNCSALFWAVKRGSESTVVKALAAGADVQAKDDKGVQPVSFALQFQRIAIFRLLIDHAIDVSGRYIFSAMTSAGWLAHEDGDFVRFILSKGADVELEDDFAKATLCFAAAAGNESVVRPLLESGRIDVDSRSYAGRTPLTDAIISGKEAIVKLLLEHGADVNFRCNSGETPLFYAVQCRRVAMVRLLLDRGAKAGAVCDRDRTPLMKAVVNFDKEVMEILLACEDVNVNQRDEDDRTALYYAADYTQYPAVRRLLQVEDIDIDAQTLLDQLACFIQIPRDVEILQLLWLRGIDINDVPTTPP